MERGQFRRLFIGNMFSGKTTRLITEVETLRRYGNKKVAVFKPRTDTRSGEGRIKAQDGRTIQAFEISAGNPWEVLRILREEEAKIGCRFEILVFDEINFFRADSGFFQLTEELLSSGYDIIAAGLPLDFKGEPFGSTLLLAWFAQSNCLWLTAYCTKCGEPALFIQRLLPSGEAAPYTDPQVLVGDKGTYEPRCHNHFVLPGKPAPPL